MQQKCIRLYFILLDVIARQHFILLDKITRQHGRYLMHMSAYFLIASEASQRNSPGGREERGGGGRRGGGRERRQPLLPLFSVVLLPQQCQPH